MLLADRDRKLLQAIHRYQAHRGKKSPVSRFTCLSGKLGHMLWSLLSASDISREAKIDISTRIPHPVGVVIHARTVIEPDCLIMQHVTLGQRGKAQGAPVIGKGAYLGAGARILGEVRIGAGARVGANAVVLSDVPDGATAVGVPARIVNRTDAAFQSA